MLEKLKEKRKLIIGIIIAVLVIGAVGTYMMIPDSLEVVTVKDGAVEPTLIGTGQVEGEKVTAIYAPVHGQVASRAVNVGDRVAGGDVLLTFSGVDQQNELAVAQAEADSAKKVLDDARNNRKKYEAQLADATGREAMWEANYNAIKLNLINMDTANRQLTSIVQTDVEGDILELQKRLAAYQTELSYVEADLKKAEILNSTGPVNDLTLRAISLQGKIYDTNAEIVEHKKIAAKVPTDGMSPEVYNTYLVYQEQLEATMRNWTQAKNDKSTAESMIAAYRDVFADEGVVKKSQIVLNMAQDNMNKASAGCVAPCAGIITSASADAGAVVEKGAKVFEIQADNSYKLKMQVSRFDIKDVKVGQAADISIEGKPYKGQVLRISQVAEKDASGKPKANVEVAISTTEPLIVGLDADVVVDLGKIDQTLCVPTKCIYKDDDGSFVFIINNEVVEKKYVTVGMSDSKNTQILDGVAKGDHIVSDLTAENHLGEKVGETMVEE